MNTHNNNLMKRAVNGSFASELKQSKELRDYLAAANKYELLDSEREHELATRARAGNVQARNTLVEHNLRLVISVTQGYCGRGMSAFDLIQEGNIGLIDAANTFDPNQGTRFSTHATWRIGEAISTALAEKNALITLPRYLFRARMNVVHAENRFYEEHGRKPTDDELVTIVPITRERLRYVRQSQRHVSSLDYAPSQNQQSDGDVLSVADRVADAHAETEDDIIWKITSETIHELMEQCLTPREQVVLALLYGLGNLHGATLSQREVAQRLSITRQEVAKCHASALRNLRAAYGEQESAA